LSGIPRAIPVISCEPDWKAAGSKKTSPQRKRDGCNISGSGKTGLKVSQLCLGTMSMGSSTWEGLGARRGTIRFPSCGAALDLGITFFDMADWYSTGRNEGGRR